MPLNAKHLFWRETGARLRSPMRRRRGGEEFTLTLSMGGEEVGRFEAVPPILSNLSTLRYRITGAGNFRFRGFVVLDKP